MLMISSNVEDIKYINSQSSCFSASPKAVILPQTIASQKSLAARLSEGRAISTFHIKQLEYLENVQRIF